MDKVYGMRYVQTMTADELDIFSMATLSLISMPVIICFILCQCYIDQVGDLFNGEAFLLIMKCISPIMLGDAILPIIVAHRFPSNNSPDPMKPIETVDWLSVLKRCNGTILAGRKLLGDDLDTDKDIKVVLKGFGGRV